MDIPDLVEDISEVQDIPVAVETPQYELKSSVPSGTRRIPVTIVTGYLGSGKSTLLQAIGQRSDLRLAIILNEFGDTAEIEKSVTIESKGDAVQEWLDLGNGCLCCTVKDNGVAAIEQLVEKSGDKIDHILLETTGVADPAPIVRMFWLDAALKSNIYIDGVVTVVDTENLHKCLDDVGGHWHTNDSTGKNSTVALSRDFPPTVKIPITPSSDKASSDFSSAPPNESSSDRGTSITTCHLQIALADVVLLNKADRVDQNQQNSARERVQRINANVPIYSTSFGDVALDRILGLHAYDTGRIGSLPTPNVFHDDRITTVAVTFPFFPDDSGFAQVERFLQQVLWEGTVDGQEVEVHRCKGILVRGGESPRVRVVQAVRETYEMVDGCLLEGVKENKLVFIGKNLDKGRLERELGEWIR